MSWGYRTQTPGPWQLAVLTANYTGTAYYRLGLSGDTVEFMGAITGVTGGVVSMMTLPVGYRPLVRTRASLLANASTGGATYLEMDVNGLVRSSLAAGGLAYLDGTIMQIGAP